MTTVHHPPLKGLGAQHDPNWLWVGLTVVTVVLIMAAITWTTYSPTVTETATPGAVIDTELAEEATAFHLASPGVTTQYFGADGAPEADWVRELAVGNVISLTLFNGMELDHEATPARFAAAGVTTQYFGANGIPEADWVRELAVGNVISLSLFNGMELDHEVTPIHFAAPGVTVLYFGNSDELDPER
jgi:hypothetical protein